MAIPVVSPMLTLYNVTSRRDVKVRADSHHTTRTGGTRMADGQRNTWRGKPRTLPIQKFIERTRRDENGCLIWTATINSAGYGNFKVGKISSAHRFAYEYFIGPIPDGLDIDHLCRNRACCDPLHLEAVPRRINLARGQMPNMVTHRTRRCKRGHEFGDDDYYASKGAARRTCRICHKAAAKKWRERFGLEYHRARRARLRQERLTDALE